MRDVFQLHMEYGCLTFIFYQKYFLEACNFIKKETLAQMFSCEFCEISKNTYFTEHLWTTASVSWWIFQNIFDCW